MVQRISRQKSIPSVLHTKRTFDSGGGREENTLAVEIVSSSLKIQAMHQARHF
jgi:hypothetical protein